MPRHATPLDAGGERTTALIVDTVHLLPLKTTTGTMMVLAMTCRALHLAVLGYLCKRVEESIRRPLERQPIFQMPCPHNCDPMRQPSSFVQSSAQPKRGRVAVRCTHCLYSFDVSLQYLPSSTWWMTPAHAKQVETILHGVGARHALLTAARRLMLQ